MKLLTRLSVVLLFGYTVSGCQEASFKNPGKKTTATTSTSTTIAQTIQGFFREIIGGNSVATSASYKLKGVSIGAVANQESASASYKNKDAVVGKVKENN